MDIKSKEVLDRAVSALRLEAALQAGYPAISYIGELSEMLDGAATTIDALRAEVYAEKSDFQRDAIRYRWLRDKAGNETLDNLKPMFCTAEFDAAVDAAMKDESP